MFNNHTMTLITDLSLVANDIRNIDFVTVAAITTSNYPDQPNVYYAGVLIPPTEMLMEWADGNQFILQSEYPKYLATPDCDDIIIALIAAMTQKNIILYIPKDEFDVFGLMLLNHIYYTYGIVCNTPTSRFSINPDKIPLIISKFYMIDVMTAKDYLDAYPANYQLPLFVINKLAEELRPFAYPASFEQYVDFFNKMNASKASKQDTGKVMVEVVRR